MSSHMAPTFCDRGANSTGPNFFSLFGAFPVNSRPSERSSSECASERVGDVRLEEDRVVIYFKMMLPSFFNYLSLKCDLMCHPDKLD